MSNVQKFTDELAELVIKHNVRLDVSFGHLK